MFRRPPIPSPDQRGRLAGAAPLLAAGREARGPGATAPSERCCSAKRLPSSSPRAASRPWSPTAAPTAAPRSRWARSRASRSSAPTTAGSGRARTAPAPASPRCPTRARSLPAPASRPFRRACTGAWSGRSLEEPLGEPPDLPWFDAETWTWGHGTPFELPVGLGVMIENFRDVAHFAFVHETTLGPLPEVVEPLDAERDGHRGDAAAGDAVRRRRRASSGAPWARLRYHVIAPNFISVQMFTDDGERCLLHAARAISATESAHYWIEGGLGEGFDDAALEEAIDYEWRVYARGPADHLGGRAARAVAGPQRRHEHPRRPVHPRLPARLRRVRRARAQPPYSGMNGGFTFATSFGLPFEYR